MLETQNRAGSASRADVVGSYGLPGEPAHTTGPSRAWPAFYSIVSEPVGIHSLPKSICYATLQLMRPRRCCKVIRCRYGRQGIRPAIKTFIPRRPRMWQAKCWPPQ